MIPEEMAGLWGEWSTKEKSLFSLTTLWEDWVQFLSVVFFFFFEFWACIDLFCTYVWVHMCHVTYEVEDTFQGWILSFHHVGPRAQTQVSRFSKHLYLQSLSLAHHWWLYEDVWKQEGLGFRLRFALALSLSWDWVLSVSFSVLPRCMKNYPGKPQVLKRAKGLV